MRIFLLIWALTAMSVAVAGPSLQLEQVRAWSDQQSTRVVFDLTGEAAFDSFTLGNPDRIVVDIKNARLPSGFATTPLPMGPIKNIRSSLRPGGQLRVVLDLSQSVESKVFALSPQAGQGHRLVIDMPGVGRGATAASNRVAFVEPPPAPVIKQAPLRDVVVVIDAGHGGKDVGAIGASGLYEKDVVLAVSKQLARLINNEPGMRAVMTREGDSFLKLRERTSIAREHNADLFISIHADSFKNTRAKGASVYALSERGASSEAAKLLAEKENAADLIAGVEVPTEDPILTKVLLDLSQTGSIKESLAVGGRVLRHLGGVGKLHKHHVEQAGFAVLKSRDIPSILVELAFISNPGEEKRLKNNQHQQKMAQAVLSGVRDYFSDSPPPGTLLAKQDARHVIRSGDTLSALAFKYQVSMDQLKSLNGLKNDRLRVGQTIRIPGSQDS